MCLVHRFGKHFGIIAEHMPHRGTVQCRCRYRNYLERVHSYFGSFAEPEDLTILAHVEKYGPTKWGQLSDYLNRPTANVRHRYRVIMTFLQENPGADVSQMPRRNLNYVLKVSLD